MNKMSTKGNIHVSMSYTFQKWVRNLETFLKIKTNYFQDKFDGKMGCFYSSNRFNSKTSLNWGEKHNLSQKVMVQLFKRNENLFGLGLGITFNPAPKIFSLYNISLWLRRDQDSIVLQHVTSKEKWEYGKINCFLEKRVNDDLQAGVGIKLDLHNDERKIKFGMIYRPSKDSCVKYMMKTLPDNMLRIKPTFAYRISNYVNLSIANRVDIGNPEEKEKTFLTFYPFCISLNFGEA
jgi:hypothetical protein